MSRVTAPLLLFCSLAPCLPAAEEYESEPICYSATPARDRVEQLRLRLEEGRFDFRRGAGERAYLQSVLEAFGVPPASQVLVFSKTSLQAPRIDPAHPRAIYFSDDCYVGWVPGGDVELIAMDPDLGAVFYRLEVPRADADRSRIRRDAECLRCHAGLNRDQLPGLLVRSVVPDAMGEPITAAGSHFTDFRSPLSERWGGWYVTGAHGAMRHMGNVTALGAGAAATLDREVGANQPALPPAVDAAAYLMPGSDVAALMVFEHQVTVHGAILAAHYAARRALHRDAVLAGMLGRPEDELGDTCRRLLEEEADRLVQVLLCRGEFALQDDGIEAGAAFAGAYAQGARRTADGRSLRDLQLLTRVYKYRCSPLVYSEAFANLPVRFRSVVLDRLAAVLDGRLATDEERGRYAYLGDGERERIGAILRETLRDLPAAWR